MATTENKGEGREKEFGQAETPLTGAVSNAEEQASTDFGNDVKEIKTFSDDSEPVVFQIKHDTEHAAQMEDRFWDDEEETRNESREETGSGMKAMLADRLEDVKAFASDKLEDLKDLAYDKFDALKEEWKTDRKSVIRKAATAAVVTSAAVALLVARRRMRKAYA